MVCGKCGSQVQEGEVFCQNCGSEVNNNGNYNSSQNQVVNNGGTTTDKNPTTYIVLAVLEIVLCCWPLGIPALIYAIGANTAFKNGDYDTMENKLKTSKTCLIIGVVGSLVAGVLYFLLAASNM